MNDEFLQTYTTSNTFATETTYDIKIDESELPQPGVIVRMRKLDDELSRIRLCEVISFKRITKNEWPTHYEFVFALLPSGIHFHMTESSDFFRLMPRATALEGLAEADNA